MRYFAAISALLLLMTIINLPQMGVSGRPDPDLDLSSSVDVPTWSQDDHWNYSTTFNFVYNFMGFPITVPFTGWINMSVSFLTLEGSGMAYPYYILTIEGNLTGHTTVPFVGEIWIYLDVDGYFWQRVQDLAVNRMVANVTVSGSIPDINGFYPFGYEYRPAMEEYDFPLVPGDIWKVDTFATLPFSPDSPGIDVQGNFSCGSPIDVVVGAGTFTSYPLIWEDGSLYYNSTVGNAVKRTLSITADTISMDLPLALRSYHRSGNEQALWIRVKDPQPVWAGSTFDLEGYFGGSAGSVHLFLPGMVQVGNVPILGGPKAFTVTLTAPWDTDDTPTDMDHSSLGILGVAVGMINAIDVCTVTT